MRSNTTKKNSRLIPFVGETSYMAASIGVLALLALAVFASPGDAAVVEHTFRVGNLTMSKLCEAKVITAVNGQLPGPTIEVSDGDTVVVHVINESPHGITIHWHGVTQLLNGWADGAEMITQCPISPGNNYTYRFNITDQEGTLWWHAHVTYLRATVHGALIIRPKRGIEAYPFPKPDKEVTIVLGEWWKAKLANPENLNDAIRFLSDSSDAFTINGKPGSLYNCSNKPEDTFKLNVQPGRIYLLRIINAALNDQFFYKVAGHSFTVVAADAGYTKPFHTDLIAIAPGQTVDALMVTDAAPSTYYMAAHPYNAETPDQSFFENTTTVGIVQYDVFVSSTPSDALMPQMPPRQDTATAHHFYTSLASLLRPGEPTVPLTIDEHMFITIGMGKLCNNGLSSCNVRERFFVATMNNISFQFPKKMSILEAHYRGIDGIYTTDFPGNPPSYFNFTNPALHDGPLAQALELGVVGTKVKKLKYNATVEIVLQSTSIGATQNHPLHIHGLNFFVLAQGFGNYNAEEAIRNYNLVDPQVRNTISVPIGGWAVIRFIANNPGAWIMHCHLEVHVPMGMVTAFEVENGPTLDRMLPPPPKDYPKCPMLDTVDLKGREDE